MSSTKRPLGDISAFWIVFAALIAFHVTLILSSRLLPFVDLPNHLSEATIVRYHDESSTLFSKYYNVGHILMLPNTFHIFFCSLPIFPSVEIACRFLYALYAALLPLSILLLVTRVGGNRWLSLLAFPLIYNYNAVWGFVGFTVAIPVIVLVAALSGDLYAVHPTVRRIAVSVLLLLLFYMHALGALFGILLFLAMQITLFARSPRRLLIESVPAIPASIWFCIWMYNDRTLGDGGTMRFLLHYYTGDFWHSLAKRLAILVYDNIGLFGGTTGMAVATAMSVSILSLLALVLVRKRPESSRIGKPMNESRLCAVFLLCSALSFAVLPPGIPGQYYLNQRFSVLVWLSLIAAVSRFAPRVGRGVRGAMIALAMIHFGLYAQMFTEFNSRNSSFSEALFSGIPRSSRLTGLIYDREFRGMDSYIQFPNYFIVWNKGIASTLAIDYRFGAIRRAVPTNELASYEEYVPSDATPFEDYKRMDCILVRGTPDSSGHALLENFALTREASGWRLYEKKDSAAVR